MFKKSLILLIVVAAVLGALIYIQPADFSIARTATVSAPPAVVFPQVNDLHNMQNWSPWAKLDPTSKATFTGPPAGVGASMAWAGNKKVGEGKMTITDSRPNQLVQMRLDFYKPMAATNTSEFIFQPDGPKTVVTWRMSGHNNFVGKAISLVMNCDKMIGGEFEKGLANLNAVVSHPVIH